MGGDRGGQTSSNNPTPFPTGDLSIAPPSYHHFHYYHQNHLNHYYQNHYYHQNRYQQHHYSITVRPHHHTS